jgi:3-(methylsulfanyl)propanoyl-CoA dehydrogenase
VRSAAQARADLLIPIVKAWSTELGIEIASTGIQVHGGMGYIEETGAAQFLRDVRITAIYEGTTGIQANDLIGRKIGRDGGAAMKRLLADMRAELAGLAAEGTEARSARDSALEGVEHLSRGTESLLRLLASDPARAAAVAVPYLNLCGFTLGGWLMARSAEIAARQPAGADREFYAAKLQTARFYAEQMLPNVLALERIVERGSASVAEARLA